MAKKVKSIIQNEKVCYITGDTYNLHEHHVFGGAYKNASDRLGLTIYLRADWHDMADYGIHFNKELREKIQDEVQRFAMEYYGWDIERWFIEVGRSFLKD